jgi:carbamoylphosphate synthase small subunit
VSVCVVQQLRAVAGGLAWTKMHFGHAGQLVTDDVSVCQQSWQS